MNTDLIRRTDLAFEINGSVRKERNEVLALASGIESVVDDATLAEATRVAQVVQDMLSRLESARVEVKAPLLDAGRKLDAAVKDFSANLKAEQLRLNKLIGDHVTNIQAKQRAEEASRLKELSELEIQRQAELAKANSHEEREAIQDRFHAAIAAASPPLEAEKPKGLSVRADEIEFEITDKRAFVTAHWNLVKDVQVDRLAIKDALKAGTTLIGVKSWTVTKISVRGKAQKAIEL